jgi:branched-chain amino acid transport system ATP-binding protein
MIAIARALMAAPKMLMLDEPSLGLAPLLVKEIFENVEPSTGSWTPPFWWWSRMPRSRCRFPTMPISWNPAKSSWKAPPKSCATIRMSKEFYMGITQGGRRKSFKEVKSYKRRKRWM